MAIKYGFFNSVNGDRKYNADDIGRYLHGLISSGVYADETNSLQVVANGGLQIAVQPGRAMLDYHYMENDAPLVLELSAGGTMDRIDIVVARLDLSNRLCEIIVREGTPASAPTRPIIYKTDLAKEYLLASIRVTKLATSITQSDITDTRADDTVCGWVRSIVGQGNAGIPVPAQSDAGKVPVVKSDGSGYGLKNANELEMPGDMDMGGYRITTLGPPKDGTDAATKDYVDKADKIEMTATSGSRNGTVHCTKRHGVFYIYAVTGVEPDSDGKTATVSVGPFKTSWKDTDYTCTNIFLSSMHYNGANTIGVVNRQYKNKYGGLDIILARVDGENIQAGTMVSLNISLTIL